MDFVLINEDEGQQFHTVDMPWLGSHALVLKERAVEALKSILLAHGEVLPLICCPELWLFNATCVIDALDHDESDIVRFRNGRIMDVRRYVFKPSCISKLQAFKISDFRVSPIFVSQEFVNQCAIARLSGVEFELIWESGE
ncbi:MAG: hypothetical protein E8D46_00240 [Nitrospira sp.]|nr:hypothetical protein [Nitrospira sp.]TKB76077.1 MAG: hypothetical protein E8D46_00240 [Nitrospira sp.]